MNKQFCLAMLAATLVLLTPMLVPDALSAKARFERFGVQDGLSDNTITAVCRDSRGFMWFGTRNGLNRFDGHSYVCFKHDPNDSTSLSDNLIRIIFEDSHGDLWIGTANGGLNRYDADHDTFESHTHDPGNPRGLSHNTIQSIAEGADGTIWVGTMNGLGAFDRTTRTFKNHFHDPSNPHTLNHSNVGSVYVDHSGAVWIGTNAGLNVMDPGTGIVRRLPDRNPATSGLNQNIMCILEDRRGILWLSTWGGGLRTYDPIRDAYRVFLHDPKDPASIRDNVVGNMAFDNQGVLWFGTTSGLHTIRPDDGKIVHFNHDPNDPFSLSSDSIWAVYCDTTGIIWIGTLFGGGNKFVPSKSIFEYHSLNTITKGASQSGYVHKFCEIGPSIWFASDKGVHRFDPVGNKFASYFLSKGDERGSKFDILRSLYGDRDGVLWLGTALPGFVRFDMDRGTFNPVAIPLFDSTPLRYEVNSIGEDTSGLLWLSTSQGIVTFDRRTHTFAFPNIDREINRELISSTTFIFDAGTDNVWLAGEFGLSLFDRKKASFKRIFSNQRGSRSLRSNIIYSAVDDGRGSLWLGTSDGLYSYDKKTGDHHRYSLFNDTVRGLTLDKKGHIWASTDAGLSRIDMPSGEIFNFDPGDGIPSIDNIDKALYCGSNGQIYVGVKNGFYHFHPDSIHTRGLPPPMVITSLKIDNLETKFEKSITMLSSVTLPYSRKPITIEFSALDFVNPAKNRFAYRMEGLDGDWIQSGNQRKVTYTHLEPGTYTFSVKAANSRGVWNNEGVSLKIMIHPPFWKTIWFRFLSFVFIAGLAALGYVIRLRNVLNRNRELERRVSERTEELQRINIDLTNEIERRARAEKKIKVLSGLIPICASCKKIRDDKGYWNQLEHYIKEHSEADFTHGICPDCMKKLYPEYYREKTNNPAKEG